METIKNKLKSDTRSALQWFRKNSCVSRYRRYLAIRVMYRETIEARGVRGSLMPVRAEVERHGIGQWPRSRLVGTSTSASHRWRCWVEWPRGRQRERADRPPSAGDLMPSSRRHCARITRYRIMLPYLISKYLHRDIRTAKRRVCFTDKYKKLLRFNI